MDVKLFSLCKQEVPESEAGKKYIFECVKSFFPDCEGFHAFTSQKRMLLAISQSLRAADIVIVAVQNNMYNATKKLLSAALDLKTAENSDVACVLSPLLETGKIKQNTFEANIRFPLGAEILPTDSALNCGFALTAGGQHIIYLPIEAPRADEVVLGSLYDYLATICDEEATEKAFDIRHKAIVKRTADKFAEDSVKAAFSGSQTVKFIKNYLPNTDFVFEDDKNYVGMTKEELINQARNLRSNTFSQLGIVISDIQEDEEASESFITIAIADENGTNTVKICREKNEADELFIVNCIDKVMLIIYNHEALTSPVDDADIVTKADKSLRKNLVTVASSLIGASAVISLIVALIMK